MGFRFLNLTSLYRTFTSSRRIFASTTRDLPIPFFLHEPLFFPYQNHSKIIKRWHVGHSHHHHGQNHAGKEADFVFRLGLAADASLATGKAITGYLSGSTAIIADAVHSISDIGMGALASTPDVLSHSLEHGHVNDHNDGAHHHGIDMDHPVLALNMTIISICVKEGLYWITKRAGEKEGSGLMKTNAWHHRADAVSSVLALIGVAGAILGVPFLDPLAGFLVSGMILKAGVETGYQSVLELVDAAVPQHFLAAIKQTILQVEGVKGCHRLRGRRAGSFLYLDVHIEVDPFLSVSAAHDIGETVRHQIQELHAEVAEVFIHIDPSFSQCSSAIFGEQKNLKQSSCQNSDSFSIQQDAETLVSNIFSSKFSGRMKVENIIRHSLQSKTLLEVQVSMPPDMLIRDAMVVAKEAEKEILIMASNINGVSIQLQLGRLIQQLHVAEDTGKPKST